MPSLPDTTCGPGSWTGETALFRGRDPAKDQSYFLWGLPRALLPRLRFPLGELTKPEVRARARQLRLITAAKPESQEICFVPTGDYRDLLRRRLGQRHDALRPGNLVDTRGRVVGRHQGYASFTVGQRRGLGGGFDQRLYVVEIRPDTREVVVGAREALECRELRVSELNWLTAERPADGTVVRAQLRYRAPAVPGWIRRTGDSLSIELGEPVLAVTPGQSAVFFDGTDPDPGGRTHRHRVHGGRDRRRICAAGGIHASRVTRANRRTQGWPGRIGARRTRPFACLADIASRASDRRAQSPTLGSASARPAPSVQRLGSLQQPEQLAIARAVHERFRSGLPRRNFPRPSGAWRDPNSSGMPRAPDARARGGRWWQRLPTCETTRCESDAASDKDSVVEVGDFRELADGFLGVLRKRLRDLDLDLDDLIADARPLSGSRARARESARPAACPPGS